MNATLQHSSTLENKLDAVSSSVLSSLLYYDLFSYPLNTEEIFWHCNVAGCSLTTIKSSLNDLMKRKLIFCFGDYYSVRNDQEIFERRILGNAAAEKVMKKVISRSKLIASFPFVRGICISGSLSKGYFDAATDVDFFIITEPNRLWICRTFLILFKKIFLFNNKKYFCVNYFIDSENLLIPDRNIFTATELITLKPVYNYDLYQKLISLNSWSNSFFPNNLQCNNDLVLKENKNLLRKLCEKILSRSFGEWLDTFFMKQTLKHWKKEFGAQPAKEFEVNMRSRKNVSKHHPQGFQFQVLKRYEERIRLFESTHKISVNQEHLK